MSLSLARAASAATASSAAAAAAVTTSYLSVWQRMSNIWPAPSVWQHCTTRALTSATAADRTSHRLRHHFQRQQQQHQLCSSAAAPSAAATTTISSQQSVIDDVTLHSSDVSDNAVTQSVLARVDKQLASGTAGRLFAIVQVVGKQFRVCETDLIVLRSNGFVPDIGERIRLEKVLLVGGADFTLIGRPLLKPGLALVEATVVEKTLSHVKTNFFMLRRKDSKVYKFSRQLLTTLRINRVSVEEAVSGEAASNGSAHCSQPHLSQNT